jgi:GNAT superfamily N-acetyltransferase
MQIKKMTLDDLDDVTLLCGQLGYPNTLSDVEKRFHQMSGHLDYALFVARSDANEILGWIQMNVEPSSLLVVPRAEIAALVVTEKSRSQGVGKALVARAEIWAQEKNLNLIRVRSGIKRLDAHRFYKREGYELSKTSNVFVKKRKDST